MRYGEDEENRIARRDLSNEVSKLRADLAASRREFAVLGAMVARLRSTIETIHAGSGEADWIYKTCERALSQTPATVGAYLTALETRHAIGVQMANVVYNCKQDAANWDRAKSHLSSLQKQWDAARALLSGHAPAKDNSK